MKGKSGHRTYPVAFFFAGFCNIETATYFSDGMNMNQMRIFYTWLLAGLPMVIAAQDVKELYRMPKEQTVEYRVGVMLEDKKKPEAAILGTNGQVYIEDDGEYQGYGHNVGAKNLRYIKDKKGNIYVTGWADGRLGIWESTDWGISWELAGELAPDKDIIYYTVHTDEKSGDLNILYATSEGEGENCEASIWLVTSGNAGRKWSDPLLMNQKPAGCNRLMVSMTSFKDGKRWVIWTDENKFIVDRSYDGSRWLRNDISVTTDYKGDIRYGIPDMIIDNSNSQLQGMIYVSGVSQGDSTMVAWLRKSGNVGDSWTSNIPLDPAYEGDQYYPSLGIDREVGALYAVWLGRQGDELEAWFGYSLDAGQRFTSQKLASWPAGETDLELMDKPIAVTAQNEKIVVTWLEVSGNEVVQKVRIFRQEDLFEL